MKVKQFHLFGQRAVGTRSGCKFSVQTLRTDVKCAISRAQEILKLNNTVFLLSQAAINLSECLFSGSPEQRQEELMNFFPKCNGFFFEKVNA